MAGENPFTSLNDLPLDEANTIKLNASDKYGWGGFYAQENYLIHRREVEGWIRREFIAKGGKPRDEVPVYFFLGDVIGDYLKFGIDTTVLRVPLSSLDCQSISFTWPDSMYEAVRDERGFSGICRRTNTPKVYTFQDLEGIMEDLETYNTLPKRQSPPATVEAQVWDRKMLLAWNSKRRM